MTYAETVLEYLKETYLETHLPPILIFTKFAWEHFEASQPLHVQKAYENLTQVEDFQVMQDFTNWALEGLEIDSLCQVIDMLEGESK